MGETKKFVCAKACYFMRRKWEAGETLASFSKEVEDHPHFREIGADNKFKQNKKGDKALAASLSSKESRREPTTFTEMQANPKVLQSHDQFKPAVEDKAEDADFM